MTLATHRRSPAADPPRRDGPRRRRRRPRERGRPHDGRELGHARGDQLHAALGARARVHAVRRPTCLDELDIWPDGARRTAPAATPRSRCRSTTSTAGSGIGAADRAHHDPPGRSTPTRGPSDFMRPGPRVPAARPPGRRARAARPHRGRGRPRPPRRPPAGRGDLRGAPRRRLARALPVPRAVRRGAPHRDGRRSTRSSSTASRTTTPRRTGSSRPLLL